jgi:hypothetical protein
MKKIRAKKIKVSTGARVAKSMSSMKPSSITRKAFNPIGNLGLHAYGPGEKPRKRTRG